MNATLHPLVLVHGIHAAAFLKIAVTFDNAKLVKEFLELSLHK